MIEKKLKLSYRIDEKISEPLDVALSNIAAGLGFKHEPYATGFNFSTGERDLVFDSPTKGFHITPQCFM